MTGPSVAQVAGVYFVLGMIVMGLMTALIQDAVRQSRGRRHEPARGRMPVRAGTSRRRPVYDTGPYGDHGLAEHEAETAEAAGRDAWELEQTIAYGLTLEQMEQQETHRHVVSGGAW